MYSGWYRAIAQFGYGDVQRTAFFPLYPLLIHLGMLVASGQALLVALVLSNLAALAAFIGVALLAAGEGGPAVGLTSVRIFAAYPLAFFLAAPYSESLFVAFAVLTLYFARRGRWFPAAACAFFATLAHLTGVVLILPITWEFTRQHGWWRAGGIRAQLRDARGLGALLAVLMATPVAVLSYMAYLGVRLGNPTAFLDAEHQYWYHTTVPPWQSLAVAAQHFAAAPHGSPAQARMLVDYAPLALFALLTLVAIRWQPVSFTLYMLGLLYLCIASPILGLPDIYISVGRYLLAALPIFVLLGRWSVKRPRLDMLLLSTGFFAQAILCAAFLAGLWII